MNNWIIVGIPLLLKAIILGIQNTLEVILEYIGIHKRTSIILMSSSYTACDNILLNR